MQTKSENRIYDCIVIGAGPAGLSAALMLARYGRPVLVFDDARPRNACARAIRGFLGHDGIAPEALREKGRAEVCRYGGQFINCTVGGAARAIDSFEVRTSETYLTRTLLLATGVRDVLPDIPGLSSFYGTSIHHCPDCDGYEARGKHVAVLGNGEDALGLIKALRVWTSTMTLLLDGGRMRLSDEERDAIERLNVGIAVKAIAALQGNGSTRQIEGIRFVDGDVLRCDALFFDFGRMPAGALHRELGCELDAETQLIKVGSDQQTSVPGVYAAGDITPDSHMSIVAAAEGAMAAIQIHKSLLRAGKSPDSFA